ncbi:hypothetical protein DFA_01026 [Cavenderia fasciculata]|uniref:Uncharacterized protein n=1 Tax=Cavenderia fasciculata TaxID=261658 RepID=F4PV35_CACFS|nr:uncharacterized protein DFA_01026 [Cavenderia fasciculata]EGG21151.1 hypothetical protein DFA_01026 [Cavenderia fasciculata]|eukprot:XP_004359001.1 hypothetical protein DFA_01026 [Cavenderia fasciculata]
MSENTSGSSGGGGQGELFLQILRDLKGLVTKHQQNSLGFSKLFQKSDQILKNQINQNIEKNVQLEQQQQKQSEQIEQPEQSTTTTTTTTNINIDIEQLSSKHQKEIENLENDIEQLHKVITTLEIENNSHVAAYSDLKSSVESIVDKGRLQMKLFNESNQSNKTLQHELEAERAKNHQLRRESETLKSTIADMFELLQGAAQSDDPLPLEFAQLIEENKNLRNMLFISDQFQDVDQSSSTQQQQSSSSTSSSSTENENQIETS